MAPKGGQWSVNLTATDTMTEAGDLSAGARIDRWTLDTVLARGAWATIYAARDVDSDEPVAIKEYHPRAIAVRDQAGVTLGPRTTADRAAYEDGMDRFHREAALLLSLHHSNIVAMRGTAEANGTVYIAMERLDGVTFERLLAERDADVTEAELRAVLSPVCDAVSHLHRRGWLHRDIKPANVFVGRDGRVTLIDLGAAAKIGGPAEGRVASELTPGYAAPEQHLAGATEGRWTDVYGLGALAYRAIAGRPPPSAADRLAGQAMEPAVAVGDDRYSPALLAAIDQALRTDTAARPESVWTWEARMGPAPVGDDDDGPPTVRVRRVADTGSDDRATTAAAPRPGAGGPAHPRGKRRGRTAAIAVLSLVVIAAVGVGGLLGWREYQRLTRTEWRVDPSGAGHARTIAEAIARATRGAMVRIAPGEYVESLSLAVPLRLEGAGTKPDDVVIAPARGPCLAITAAQGMVRAIAFRAAVGESAPCVDIQGGGIAIESVIVRGSVGPALRVSGGATPTVRGSDITGAAGPALLFEDGAKATMVESRVAGGERAAIIVRSGADPLVSASKIRGGGQAAVLVARDGRGRFVSNDIRGAAYSGIEIRDGGDPELTGNTIEGAVEAGVYVYADGRGRLNRNRIAGNGLSGVVIDRDAAPSLEDNAISDNAEHGVLVLDGGGGDITGNAIVNNLGHGVVRSPDSAADIRDNRVEGNRKPQMVEGRPKAP